MKVKGLLTGVLLLVASTSFAATTSMTADWSRSSGGLSAGGQVVFGPDKNFAYIHIDSMDVAVNGPFSASGTVWITATATYEDGSVLQTSFLYATEPQLDSPVEAGTLSGLFKSGKRMTKLTLAPQGDALPTVIIWATGTETTR